MANKLGIPDEVLQLHIIRSIRNYEINEKAGIFEEAHKRLLRASGGDQVSYAIAKASFDSAQLAKESMEAKWKRYL